jgi:DHA1 family bicyclomycin/chloramphenicol resistance-like MFS transporter
MTGYATGNTTGNTAPKPSITPPSLFVLVAISTLQPFALNVLAPATPSLAVALATDYATIQLTLSVYLLAVAVTQLVVGPLSDRYGRRPCVLIGLALYVAGSALGAFAPSVPVLLLARVIQAAGGGAVFALARAIVRDTSERDAAASRIGYLTMAMVVSPMVAPVIGGFVDAHFGWRIIFLVMVGLGLIALVIAALRLPETRRMGAGVMRLGDVLRGGPALLTDRRFLGYALAMTFTSAAFFAFLAGAPYLVIEVMGRTPDVYGTFFVLNALGYMIGNFASGRFAQRLGADRMVTIGTSLSFISILIEGLVVATLPWTPLGLFGPLMINAVGNGLTLPGATAAALSVRPELAGTAAGLSGALQLGTGALVSFIVGYSVSIWPPSLILVMLVTVTLGFIAHRIGQKPGPRAALGS